MMGGQVGIVGHVTISDHTLIATRSGVSKSLLKKSGKYRGSPAIPINEYNETQVYLRKIKSFVKKQQDLEKRLAQLESLTIQQDRS